jgi:hypothetical protein
MSSFPPAWEFRFLEDMHTYQPPATTKLAATALLAARLVRK